MVSDPRDDASGPADVRQHYVLEALLEMITEENLHAEIDFGPPVGREVLPPWDSCD